MPCWGEGLAGRPCNIEIEAHAVIAAVANIAVHNPEVSMVRSCDVVVLEKPSGGTPYVAGKGLRKGYV